MTWTWPKIFFYQKIQLIKLYSIGENRDQRLRGSFLEYRLKNHIDTLIFKGWSLELWPLSLLVKGSVLSLYWNQWQWPSKKMLLNKSPCRQRWQNLFSVFGFSSVCLFVFPPFKGLTKDLIMVRPMVFLWSGKVKQNIIAHTKNMKTLIHILIGALLDWWFNA